ncbi:uncharacterized protein [Rutidosis leptorrhynchoides]|uniref:uncharacterized protein n=1 Tax=Rutidosis leptorrhynchoides TaxID=125765 RepID=UPI003A99FDF9
MRMRFGFYAAIVSLGYGYKIEHKMPPKKKNEMSVDHAVPSSSGGCSGVTHSKPVKKRKKSTYQRSVSDGGSTIYNEPIVSSNSFVFGSFNGRGLSSAATSSCVGPSPFVSSLQSIESFHQGSNISLDVTNEYEDVGDCNCVCSYCGAMFWYEERLRVSPSSLNYNRCCEGGRVSLPREETPPQTIIELLNNKHFMDNIRAYNQMFSMASYGAHIDDEVNNGRGPYVFKISGQVYHWIGSLCPEEGNPPSLNSDIVISLIKVLDSNNELLKLFRTVRDKIKELDVPDLRIRTQTGYDLIIECKGGTPQRVNKLHPSYMSLQFPLMFIYGQPGYHPGMTLRPVSGTRSNRKKKLTMNTFYSYQLHDRFNQFGLLSRCGRLFQQYIVTVYYSIELDRLDYVRRNQRDIRNEYLSGLYDALDRGDHYGFEVGSRTILPASYTGGPRYMYSHYLDALAICRVYGNPRFFITFTCNTKWPEIKRYLHKYSHLTANDRADIISRIFHIKVRLYVSALKEEELLGIWKAACDVDRYISAELPDPTTDPKGFKVVSEMMMHGPCGLVNRDAPCMQDLEISPSGIFNKDNICLKRFPKVFNEVTYFDKDGFVHYRRRNSGISVDKGICNLDNGYVVPYNRTLCLKFHTHINVEWCGWTMLIKYLFKYISKGSDRIAARIPKPLGSSSSTNAERSSNIDEI